MPLAGFLLVSVNKKYCIESEGSKKKNNIMLLPLLASANNSGCDSCNAVKAREGVLPVVSLAWILSSKRGARGRGWGGWDVQRKTGKLCKYTKGH